MGVFGSAIKRREDPALLRGDGKFTDDLTAPGMAHAVIVRSPYPHARINSIDTADAAAQEGVAGVFTMADLTDDGVGVVPVGWLNPGQINPTHTLLATDTVRHVGDGVAVVVAEDNYAAQDAADLVHVDYEPLPAVSDVVEAAADGAPLVHEEAPGNIGFDWGLGDLEATEAALAAAAHVVEVELRNNRMYAHPIEPRAALADFDAATGKLTLHMTSQAPHVVRLLMTLASMGLPESKIRVVAPEVGGGFGGKIHHYADEAIASWCSIRTGRPVKWTATRVETNLTDSHGRDHYTKAWMGFDADHRITAWKIDTLANMGAYYSTFAPCVPTALYAPLASGQYDMPAIHVHSRGVFTNTTPVDATRGAGRPEMTFLIERTMDMAARELGVDPVELRRKNFVAADNFPYQTQVAVAYDSGNYQGTLDKGLENLGYEALRAEQEERRQNGGKLLGIGFATYIEACGIAPSQVVGSLGAQAGLWESAKVRVHPTGTVTVLVGTSGHGQGHETTYAQIVADRLGIDMDAVEVVEGDTDEVQFGMGTYGSRSAAVGGSALAQSVDKVIAKCKVIAAHLLEAAPEDVVMEDASFQVQGAPGKTVGWGDVVLQAYLAHNLPEGLEPGLEETTFYDPANFVFPFGCHAAVVEVDPATGAVEVQRYVAVDDCGPQINPMIVAGQVHGGVAHGIGQALFEEVTFDEHAQPTATTLMDYAMPKAHQVPAYELDHTETPAPHNPLGVKGIGEAGAIAAPAAVTNAVVDALSHLGVRHLDMPLTPERVWRAIQGEGS